MARLRRKTKKEENKSFQDSHEIKKLSLIITIVNKGTGKAIVNLLNRMECACSFIHRGEGTASKDIYDILGFQDNSKDVIFSIIKDEKAGDVKREVESFLLASKKNNGVSLRIPLSSIVGINAYRFLANVM